MNRPIRFTIRRCVTLDHATDCALTLIMSERNLNASEAMRHALRVAAKKANVDRKRSRRSKMQGQTKE